MRQRIPALWPYLADRLLRLHYRQEDMTMLLEDDACFDAYFNTMPQALELHQACEQRLKSNIAIAGELEP